MKQLAYILITFVVALGIGAMLGERYARRNVTETERTIVRYDTIVYRQPETIVERCIAYRTIRLPLAETDSVTRSGEPDSAAVTIPLQQRVYQDTTYTAYVSGYEPRLDSIAIYPRTEIRYVMQKPKRWGLSVQAGYGLTEGGIRPYVGIGISYTLYNF